MSTGFTVGSELVIITNASFVLISNFWLKNKPYFNSFYCLLCCLESKIHSHKYFNIYTIFLILIAGEDILTFSPTVMPHGRDSTTVGRKKLLWTVLSEVEFYQKS